MEQDKKLVEKVLDDICDLDKKIGDIGKDNIISHSSLDEASEMVKGIDKEINNIKGINRKRTAIKGVKVFGRLLKEALPYVVVAGILFGGQSLIIDPPFIKQDVVKIADYEKTIDNTGATTKKLNYVESDEKSYDNLLSYTSKWEKKQDGFYYQTIKEYEFRYQDDVQKVYDNFINENVTDKLEGITQKAKSTKYLKKAPDELTPEELAKDDYIKLMYHTHDENDIIIEAQSDSSNTQGNIIYILMVVLACACGLTLENLKGFYIIKYLKELKEKYPSIDIKDLVKLFEEERIKVSVIRKQQVNLIDPITGEKHRFV